VGGSRTKVGGSVKVGGRVLASQPRELWCGSWSFLDKHAPWSVIDKQSALVRVLVLARLHPAVRAGYAS